MSYVPNIMLYVFSSEIVIADYSSKHIINSTFMEHCLKLSERMTSPRLF